MYKIYIKECEESLTDPVFERLLPLLPEDRIKKALRYRNIVDRNNCVVTYIMLKNALQECFRVDEFTMQYDNLGKPFLKEYPNIHFSISHCKIGCAVAVADQLIGIDIQNIVTFSENVARRVCCLQELQILEQSEDKDRDFIRMWAMKESYVKMTGEGIYKDFKTINTTELNGIEIEEKDDLIISVCL